MTMKQDELKCYAVETVDNCKFYVAVLAASDLAEIDYPFFNGYNATRFDSLEELEINLQLRFPGCSVSHDPKFTCLGEKLYKITGILQRDMQEFAQTGKSLL